MSKADNRARAAKLVADRETKLMAAAKAAYVAFVRECGYEKDARVVDFEKLSPKQQERWKNVARDVIEAFR